MAVPALAVQRAQPSSPPCRKPSLYGQFTSEESETSEGLTQADSEILRGEISGHPGNSPGIQTRRFLVCGLTAQEKWEVLLGIRLPGTTFRCGLSSHQAATTEMGARQAESSLRIDKYRVERRPPLGAYMISKMIS